VNPVGYLETGVLYCDDNLERLAQFPSECVDLVYLDPPFFSEKYYEVIWGDEAEVRSFEDRWAGDIHGYIAWMRQRMIELRRVLKPTGSLYLHCDWHAGHYLKVMMDEVFGRENFVNEVVWHYKKWPSGKYTFQRNHDTIFFYSRTPSRERTFNQQYMARAASTLKRFGTKRIISGHDKAGRRVPSQVANEKSGGVRLDDVWAIGRVPPVKQLYPTQKPDALLERIITASSNKGDIVLDPFCGCGTTVKVAEELQRQWIGIDISTTAMGVMKRRIEEVGGEPKIVGLPMTEAELRDLKPFAFQNWVLQQVDGTPSERKSGDMGIDGLSFMYHEPIQVKRSDDVGRNVVDNFETAVKRSGNDTGYIVAFSFTRGAYAEAARAREAGEVNIVLITVSELLSATEKMTRPGPPMPSKRERPPTPDLMRLLSSLQRQIQDRPLPRARPAKARPTPGTLFESERFTDPLPRRPDVSS
jgi:DNA modification methylase